MWKKLVLIITLGLGGCAGTFTATNVQNIESEIQAATAQLCSFVPELNTIDAVAAALTGGVPGVGAVVALTGPLLVAAEQAICSAVPPVASARFNALPKLGSRYAGRAGVLHYGAGHGVPVNGWTVH